MGESSGTQGRPGCQSQSQGEQINTAKQWCVYIIKCKDGLLYTGITKDLKRRLKQHNSGNGCKFTKYRAPVKLMHDENTVSRSQALKREAAIKRLTRKEKFALIRNRKP